MKVCKKCGTLYNEKEGPCPKCYTEDLLISGEAAKHEIDTDMTPEETEKARKKSWIQILIGDSAHPGIRGGCLHDAAVLSGGSAP